MHILFEEHKGTLVHRTFSSPDAMQSLDVRASLAVEDAVLEAETAKKLQGLLPRSGQYDKRMRHKFVVMTGKEKK